MPYTVDSQDLPDNVKALSDTKRRQWVNVFNSALSRCEKRNGSDCEAAASRQANGVVFEEMALFTPPAETGIEGPISALAASMLTGGVGATSEWARKIVRKLDESREVTMDILQEATWSRKFINDLPDSSFLYIESGGEKDDGGKTAPRSLRMFPYKDSAGKVDLPHLRNALARIPQSNRIDAATKERLTKKARGILEDETEQSEMAEMGLMGAGPTSFADLHAAEQANNAANRVHELTYQFQTLVVNILSGDAPDKAAAIETLASEFVGLVRETLR